MELPQFLDSGMTVWDVGHVQGASSEMDEVLIWTDISDRTMKIRQYAIRIEHWFIVLCQGQGCLTVKWGLGHETFWSPTGKSQLRHHSWWFTLKKTLPVVEFEKDANQALDEFLRDSVWLLHIDVFIDKALVLVFFMALPQSFTTSPIPSEPSHTLQQITSKKEMISCRVLNFFNLS